MRGRLRVFAVACVIASTVAAPADQWQEVFRGLQLFATPSGFPLFSTGDGTRVNGARSGRLRIMPRGFGRGYQLELDRTFGVDTQGRPEEFHFGGGATLTLSGAVEATAGFSGKEFRVVDGDITINNLNYVLNTNLGVQDAELRGNFSLVGFIIVNPLGFYETRWSVANVNSQLSLDGLVVRDDTNLNFDIGPISLQGNIFVDMLAAALGALGADTSALQDLFPGSPIDLINQGINESLQNPAAVAGVTLPPEEQTGLLLLQTILTQDQAALDGLVAHLAADLAGTSGSPTEADTVPAPVPEPSAVLLVLGGGVLLLRRRAYG
jgi:hypothetical protein